MLKDYLKKKSASRGGKTKNPKSKTNSKIIKK
jgi:hypothetical protein